MLNKNKFSLTFHLLLKVTVFAVMSYKTLHLQGRKSKLKKLTKKVKNAMK